MQSDICREVLEAAQRTLAYLFTEFGFSVTAIDPASSDGRCLLVLSSSQCQFRIIFNRGDLELDVAPLSAPISWERVVAGRREWYYLTSALNYVRGNKYADLAALRRPVPFLSLEEKFEQAAADLRPDCQRVLELFSPQEFAGRQRDLDMFLLERSEDLGRQLLEDQKRRRDERRQHNS